MDKEHVIKSVKIALGVALGLTLAQWLKMDFSITVATIVIVSMLSDKKQSLKQSIIRLLSAILSLALSSALFIALGFTLPTFVLYVFIFTLLMYKLDTVIAIVLNVVLVMHILSQGQVTFSILLNEFGLLFIGVSVALVMNFFVIDIEEELIKYQKQVEDLQDIILKSMGLCLINQGGKVQIQKDLDRLNHLLKLSIKRAYQYLNNYYFQENNYYVEYFNMRRQQYHIISTMQDFITMNFLKRTEVEMLKSFTDDFINNTKVVNACSIQLERLKDIKHHFTHEAELPADNTHLQNRIALHQYLYSLEQLVSIKMRFIETFEVRSS